MKRNFQLDTLKGVLIFLVVFSHAIEFTYSKTTPIVSYIYIAIFSFHMPVFVFISGYLSKRHSQKKLIELALVYVLWQVIIYPLFVSSILNEPYIEWVQSVFNPHSSYWYLVSLLTWRIVTPYLERIKFILPLCILFGLLVGFSEVSSMTTFSFGRSIAFYPFFLVGYYLTPARLNFLCTKINRYIGFISFSLVCVFAVYFITSLQDTTLLIEDKFFTKPLMLRDHYDLYLNNPMNGIYIRSVLYVLAFLMISTIFSFMPSKETIFTRIGQQSFIIFISHYMIIYVIKRIYFSDVTVYAANSVLITAFICSFLYCALLTTKPAQMIARRLTTINIQPLWKE